MKEPSFPKRHTLIERFAYHRVAPYLLIALMALAGGHALVRLNTQFFPDFDLGMITIQTLWEGASAEDTEEGITSPLEQELRNLDSLDRMISTSASGISRITLEFKEGTDMGLALEEVKVRVDRARNLPTGAEEPEVERVAPYDPIARVLLYSKQGETAPGLREQLRPMAQRMRDELLDRGVDRVEIIGLPEQEIAIQIPSVTLWDLGRPLDWLASQIEAQSQNLPAGEVGSAEAGRQLRSPGELTRPAAFAELPVITDPEQGHVVELEEIAAIERRPQENTVQVSQGGRPAVELRLQRSQSGDTLNAARTLHRWVEETQPTLPPGVGLTVFDESWNLVKERIGLLIKNGLSGLALVLLILFLFLRGRVAVWVAVGIPVSFLAALAILYWAGGSINMISLFALIMTLGIIVDDAIVVAEEGLTRHQQGDTDAAVQAAHRMWPPVLSASLTTMAGFLPLMLVGEVIGAFLFAIPLVAICVIVASLVEAFLVLPGHLHRAFSRITPGGSSNRLRWRLERRFEQFREGPFRRAIEVALRHRASTLATGLALLALTVGLVVGGRLPFSFFPSPAGTVIYANAKFVAGTPRAQVSQFLSHLEETMEATEAELGEGLVKVAVARHGRTSGAETAGGGQVGDQFGSVFVELISPEERSVRRRDFMQQWRERIELPPGIESFTVKARTGGPPGSDVSVRLTEAPPGQLKSAAQELIEILEGYTGLSGIEDDMPYGREQLIYEVTPHGQAVGLTEEAVGTQLRDAFSGHLAQTVLDGEDEVEVRVGLPDKERGDMGALAHFPIHLQGGDMVPLDTVVDFHTRRGFEALRHADGQLAVHVDAEVDRRVANSNRVRSSLQQGALPKLEQQYGVTTQFVGKGEDQRKTLSDMRRGLVLALALIYIILAAIFSSYAFPLLVMLAIPFGLIGALIGHGIMGIDVTVLSLFGLFGLSGIVVNDSIILVTFYQQLRGQGYSVHEGLVEAACQRLRPVLLTSLTTIAGLTPLLFEDSLQAQFLIPMAVSIAFGLVFATVLVLALVPAMLSLQEGVGQRLRQRLS